LRNYLERHRKVKDAAVQNPALVDELGLTEIERELVAIDPGYKAVSPTARLDSFLTEEAYSFVELNGESPLESLTQTPLTTSSARFR
jgi:hypothetical protein